MLEVLHVYNDLEPKSAPLNMAVDEALLGEAAAPILRFYRWQQPAISFGYFGRYADAAAEANGREIVRRWTGGGIVPHGEDLTYSIILPRAQPLAVRSSPDVYATVHDAIRGALAANQIEARLAEQAAPKMSDACFANAVRADVLSGDRKIAGAAHRRSRAGLLHQGSIQRRDLPERFREDFARLLCERFERKMLAPETLNRAAQIAASKYGTSEWLMRR